MGLWFILVTIVGGLIMNGGTIENIVNHEKKDNLYYDKKELNLVIIDSSAEIYEKLFSDVCDMMLENYKTNVFAYDNIDDGLNYLNGTKNTIVFCGVEGNAIETAFYGHEFNWAKKYSSDIGLLVDNIKERKPDAKIVIFTGGNKCSKEDAKKYGAHGYLPKPSSLREIKSLLDYVSSSFN